jgi:FimV-like protein
MLPALAVLGMGGQASALELGAVDVQSTLGEPLRASIAFALNPHEEIRSYCIFLNPGRSATGLPSPGRASVTVRNGSIRLVGQKSVTEPMLALQLTVDCPYAAHLSREYVVFVDPASSGAAEAVAARAPVQLVEPRVVRPAAQRTVDPAPISASGTYRVQPGDTLSGIAERLSGRSVSIWQAVDALFAVNPGAFVANNRDLLKAGALLRIPDALYAAAAAPVPEPVDSAAPAVAAPAAAAPAAAASTAYRGYRSTATPGDRERAGDPPARPAAPVREATRAHTVVPRESAAETAAPAANRAPSPRPGDILVDHDGPFVSSVDAGDAAVAATAAIPPAADSEIATPAPAGTASSGPRATDGVTGAWSWLIWLAGSGIALILALLLFGRPLRRRFGGAQEPVFDHEDEDRAPSGRARPDEPVAPEGLVDFRFDHREPDARIIHVDGDLEDGSGFQDSGDIDVAQDFGFSASGGIELGLDVEFPDEPATVADDRDTNMIPPLRRHSDVIVESEIPPGDESGEYDVSMIVDATRPPIGDGDDTARDLRAIELEPGEAPPQEESTLSGVVDYNILEQDYEEELTATQVLNAELLKAARDLVEGRSDDNRKDAPPDPLTLEFELTAELPLSGDEASTSSDTVEMPKDVPDTAGDELEETGVVDELREVPGAQNDATAEIEIESATVDTRKMKAS